MVTGVAYNESALSKSPNLMPFLFSMKLYHATLKILLVTRTTYQ